MHTRRVTFLLLEKWMNRFIIADASKCIGCRTCEVACVVSHQEHQDCASLTPHTFQPRIHVIKGSMFPRRPPAVSVKTPLRQRLPERRHQP